MQEEWKPDKKLGIFCACCLIAIPIVLKQKFIYRIPRILQLGTYYRYIIQAKESVRGTETLHVFLRVKVWSSDR